MYVQVLCFFGILRKPYTTLAKRAGAVNIRRSRTRTAVLRMVVRWHGID